jgi:hypothetical protein
MIIIVDYPTFKKLETLLPLLSKRLHNDPKTPLSPIVSIGLIIQL